MGNLTVNLVRVNILISADRGGASDPYFVFKVNGKEVHRSEVIKKTLNPEYNETFVVPISSRVDDGFSFEVFDWDQLAVDKSLGNKHNQGEVQLRLKLMPEFLSSNKRRSGFGTTFFGGGVGSVTQGGQAIGQAGVAGVGAFAGGIGAVGQGAVKGVGAIGQGAMKGVGAIGKGVFGGLSAGASAVGFNKKADPSKPTNTSVPAAPVSSNPMSQPQTVIPTGGIDAPAMGSSQSFESQRSRTEDNQRA